MQKTLEDFLEAPDGAGKVLAHARLLLRLTRLYQTIAPAHLAASSHVANYKSGTVVIHAASGAVATKLRQFAPTLADGFSRKGIECSGVQVKVQARETGTQSTTSTPKPLSSSASQTLGDLRDTLPNSPLREALDTLLTRAFIAE
ncbi:MAG: DciA family protein [Propionivibrio sp.]